MPITSFLLVFFILSTSGLQAQNTRQIVLTDETEQFDLNEIQVEYFEDPTSALTIHKLASPNFEKRYKLGNTHFLRNNNTKANYWLKIKVINKITIDKDWLLEFFDPSIEEISLFIPDGKGGFIEQKEGNTFDFTLKYYKHKNFGFHIPDIRNKEINLYVRIKSKNLIFMYGAIRSYNKFLFYSLNEYYFLGLFYGIILAMAIYNLLLFLATRDQAYFYYVMYVLSSVFFCMVIDGTGFQYFWPSHPEFNNLAFSLSTFLMVLWVTMYIQSFLAFKSESKLHINFLELLIIVRIIIFILSISAFPSLKNMIFIDILALLICYFSGIYSLKSGILSTRFFVIGFTFFLIGFVVSNLTIHGINGIILPSNIFTKYCFNFGIMVEMILLSYALSDKVRIIIQENRESELKLIEQLKAQDALKAKYNKELEAKVSERTLEIFTQKTELEIKNDEMKVLYQEVTDNIKVAKWTQDSILPPLETIKNHLPDSFIFYQPKDVVSGDFYWFYVLDSRIYIAAIDCTGHGVSGAFMSIIGYSILTQIMKNPINHALTAAGILDKLNKGVVNTLRQKNRDAMSKDGMDVNLIIIDKKNNKLNYAGAVNYLYIIRNKELIKLIADPFSIGLSKSGQLEHFCDQEFDLEDGDLLIQYTDGYADQLGGETGYKKFLYPRFREMLVEMSDLTAENQFEIVSSTFNNWKGTQDQTDDVLVIGINYSITKT